MKTFAAAAIAAYLLILVSVFAADTVDITDPDKHTNIRLETESALLSGDWDTVAQLLDGIDEQSPSSVKRLIKGHACLALNRHDEAVTLIAKTSARGNLKSYHEWATELVGRNNANALAHYFAGDAFARLQNSEKAREAFDRAIALNSSLALAYNARGVVRAKGNDPDGAWDDFEAAIRRNPKLLDAYSNLGVLKFSQSAFKGAKESFCSAASISTEATLPAIGKACCLFPEGRWKDGERQLAQCTNAPFISTLAMRNVYGAKMTQIRYHAEQLAAFAGTNIPGSTLDFSDLHFGSEKAAQDTFGDLHTTHANLQQPFNSHGQELKEESFDWGANNTHAVAVKEQMARLDAHAGWQHRTQNAAADVADSVIGLGSSFVPGGSLGYAAAKVITEPEVKDQTTAVGNYAIGFAADRLLKQGAGTALSTLKGISELKDDYHKYQDSLRSPYTVSRPIDMTSDDGWTRTVTRGEVTETFVPGPNGCGAIGWDPSDTYEIRTESSFTTHSTTGIQDPNTFRHVQQPPGGVIAAVDIYKDVGAWDLIVPYGLAYPTANADVGPAQENNR